MTASDLIQDKLYQHIGSKKLMSYYGREGHRYWFSNINGSFWMDEKQVEELVIEIDN